MSLQTVWSAQRLLWRSKADAADSELDKPTAYKARRRDGYILIDIFLALEGTWLLDRTIPGHAKLQGVATFKRVDDCSLKYEETGDLELLGGKKLSATRSYVYRLAEPFIEIEFSGRQYDSGTPLFAKLELDNSCEGKSTIPYKHYCGKDVYELIFRFEMPRSFSSEISVFGPKKDYVTYSRYFRRSDD